MRLSAVRKEMTPAFVVELWARLTAYGRTLLINSRPCPAPPQLSTSGQCTHRDWCGSIPIFVSLMSRVTNSLSKESRSVMGRRLSLLSDSHAGRPRSHSSASRPKGSLVRLSIDLSEFGQSRPNLEIVVCRHIVESLRRRVDLVVVL
jgi:hypothetical protein